MNANTVVSTGQPKSFRWVGLASFFALAALATGCASTPPRAVAMGELDCGQVRAAIADAEKAKREATQKQQDAWKAVVPFAVLARYASSKSAVGEADAQLAELERQSAKQGCGS